MQKICQGQEETCENKKGLNKKVIAVAAIAGVVILLLTALIYFRPQLFGQVCFIAHRVKNTFSHYVLKNKPQFYYLQMEKNGKDIRVSVDDPLED